MDRICDYREPVAPRKEIEREPEERLYPVTKTAVMFGIPAAIAIERDGNVVVWLGRQYDGLQLKSCEVRNADGHQLTRIVGQIGAAL